MQEKLQKKILIPLLVLAVVIGGGAAYTLTHADRSSANAASPVAKQGNKVTDAETNDDSGEAGTKQNIHQTIPLTDSSADTEIQDGK